MTKYLSGTPVGDLLSPATYHDFAKRVATCFVRVLDSPLVKYGGTSVEQIAETFVRTARLLSLRARALLPDAAEGIASFIRHGAGHAGETAEEALTGLIDDIPAGVRDDSVESITAAVGKTHRTQLAPNPELGFPHDPKGLERANDAVKAGRSALDPHLRDIVSQHVGVNQGIKSMEEFEALRFMKAENLTPAQKDAIVAIRNAVPNPVTGTSMQRVIKGTEIEGFIISSNSNISGFVAKQDDAGTAVFGNSNDMIEGLRLDYEGGFQGQTSVGVIEWDFDSATMNVEIPRSAGFGGAYDRPYPYVGNGLTATTSGRLVPEYRTPTGAQIVPPEGAKLYALNQSGNKVLRAIFENGAWVSVGG